MSWLLTLIFNTASTKRLLLIALLAGVWGFLSAKLPLWAIVAGVVVLAVVVWICGRMDIAEKEKRSSKAMKCDR